MTNNENEYGSPRTSAVALVIVANRAFSGRLLATNILRSDVTRALDRSN